MTCLYKGFVKQEVANTLKAPRVIKAAEQDKNLIIWPMLHAFEVSLLSVLDTDGLPFFAKGANFVDRAEIVM